MGEQQAYDSGTLGAADGELTVGSVDRTKSSRMGWSDISISLSGPIVDSLAIHFVDRWHVTWSRDSLAYHTKPCQELHL